MHPFSGEKTAFLEWFVQKIESLRRTAREVLGRRKDAESMDIVQSFFHSVWRMKSEQLRQVRSRTAWSHKIVRRKAQSWLQRNYRRQEAEQCGRVAVESSHLAIVERQDELEWLIALILEVLPYLQKHERKLAELLVKEPQLWTAPSPVLGERLELLADNVRKLKGSFRQRMGRGATLLATARELGWGRHHMHYRILCGKHFGRHSLRKIFDLWPPAEGRPTWRTLQHLWELQILPSLPEDLRAIL